MLWVKMGKWGLRVLSCCDEPVGGASARAACVAGWGGGRVRALSGCSSRLMAVLVDGATRGQ